MHSVFSCVYVNDCESIGRTESGFFCPFGMALCCCEYNYWHLDTTGRDFLQAY